MDVLKIIKTKDLYKNIQIILSLFFGMGENFKENIIIIFQAIHTPELNGKILFETLECLIFYFILFKTQMEI